MSSEQLPPFSFDTLKLTQSTNPNFELGQKVDATPEGKAWLEGEKEGWKVVDTATADSGKLYQLMISAITPRPIAFLNSLSEDGVENLALFSWFNMVTQNPPLISVCFTNPGANELKDSARNILATKQFTVGIISEPFVTNANVCSVDAPRDVSEWPFSGLTKAPSISIKPSRVKESAFSMECELFSHIPIVHPETGITTTTLILGLVKYIHVRNDMLNDRGNVDSTKLKPISRLGDIQYASLSQAFSIPRPNWKNEEDRFRKFLAEQEGEGKVGGSAL